MRRYARYIAVFLVCFVLTFFVAQALDFLPTQINYCSYHKTGDQECARHYLVVIPSIWVMDHLEVISLAVTAIATAVVAWFTATIFGINKSQLTHARQVERAYVSGGATIEWEETGTYEFKPGARVVPNMRPRWLIITVNNHGKTPAIVERIATSVCPESELPTSKNLAADYERAKRLAKMTIAPGTTGLPTKFRSEFSQAAGKIIYGRFYYTDIFGDSHSSGFILKVLSTDTMPIEAAPEYTAWD